MATFVLVPGAWLGAWCWRDIEPILRRRGHSVVPVTLPGLAERAHLLDRETGLDAHVCDVSEMLRRDDLRDVILVGHSYGGAVITAAAERAPERLRCLVFLDASTPQDGDSTIDTLPASVAEQIREIAAARGAGWLLPPPDANDFPVDDERRRWIGMRLTAHPLKSLEQPVHCQSPVALRLPRAFLRTSDPTSHYQPGLERDRREGWYCRELMGGHYPMFTLPHVVAEALTDVDRACTDSGWTRTEEFHDGR